jgi:hypothetical protein
MPVWLHFVPWHWLLWLSVPFVALAGALTFASAETAALLRKVPMSWWVCAGLIVAGSLYHVATVASAAHGAQVAADAAWTAKIAALKYQYAAAQTKAIADQAALQAQIDAKAAPDNAVLSAQFAALSKQLVLLKARDIAAYNPVRQLPADCRLDPARVEAANQALSQ